jgi:hypothetical protein
MQAILAALLGPKRMWRSYLLIGCALSMSAWSEDARAHLEQWETSSLKVKVAYLQTATFLAVCEVTLDAHGQKRWKVVDLLRGKEPPPAERPFLDPSRKIGSRSLVGLWKRGKLLSYLECSIIGAGKVSLGDDPNQLLSVDWLRQRNPKP